MTTKDQWPAIVDHETWDDARSVLRQQEKALTRMKNTVSAARRRMPMVEVRTDYEFIGPVSTNHRKACCSTLENAPSQPWRTVCAQIA